MVSLRWGTSDQQYEDVIFFFFFFLWNCCFYQRRRCHRRRWALGRLVRHWNAVHRSINIKRQHRTAPSLPVSFYLFIQCNKKQQREKEREREWSISDLLFCFLLQLGNWRPPPRWWNIFFPLLIPFASSSSSRRRGRWCRWCVLGSINSHQMIHQKEKNNNNNSSSSNKQSSQEKKFFQSQETWAHLFDFEKSKKWSSHCAPLLA